MTPTTVFTRAFGDVASAEAVRERFLKKGFPARAVEVIAEDAESKHSLEERMARALVHESAVSKYASAVGGGGAVLVVRATYQPLQAPKISRELLEKAEAKATSGVTEEHRVRVPDERSRSILPDHPRFLTLIDEERGLQLRTISSMLGIPTLSHRERKPSVISGGRLMTAQEGKPMVKTDRVADSAIEGGKHMSTRFWPMPLLTDTERRKSVLPEGGPILSRKLGWPTIIGAVED